MEERFHYQLRDKLLAILCKNWQGEEKIVAGRLASPDLEGGGRGVNQICSSKPTPVDRFINVVWDLKYGHLGRYLGRPPEMDNKDRTYEKLIVQETAAREPCRQSWGSRSICNLQDDMGQVQVSYAAAKSAQP